LFFGPHRYNYPDCPKAFDDPILQNEGPTVRIARLLVWAVPATAGLLFSGCGGTQPPKPLVPTVTVARPVRRDVTDYAEFTGRTTAVESAKIRARVQGFLKTVDFAPGDLVEKDKLLFTIEDDSFQAQLDAAEAKLKQTEAKFDLAKGDLERALTLRAQNAISEQEVDEAKSSYDSAAANKLADEAAIEIARTDLSYTKVLAPFAGRVSRNLVDPGNLVGGAEKTLLTTIERIDEIYAYFDVSEIVVLEILKYYSENPDRKEANERWKVYLGVANEEGCPHEGHLDFLENKVDVTTGTALVRGIFKNDDGLLYDGLFVRVRVPKRPIKDAILVDQRALGTDMGGKYLLLVDDKNVVQEPRRVELGPLVGGMRVIRKGIGPNERYIVEGLQHARIGKEVKVEMAKAKQAAAEAGQPSGTRGGSTE